MVGKVPLYNVRLSSGLEYTDLEYWWGKRGGWRGKGEEGGEEGGRGGGGEEYLYIM